MTLTKAELTQRIADAIGLSRREASELVEGFFGEIASVLAAGEEVKLSGFGSFQLRQKSERPGRNPKTGETALVSARRVVAFHASDKLKRAVETAKHGPKRDDHVAVEGRSTRPTRHASKAFA